MTEISRRTILGAAAALACARSGKSHAGSASSSSILAKSLLAGGPHPSLGHHAETYGRFVGSWAGEYRVFLPQGTKSGQIRVSFGWILDGRAIQDSGWAFENEPDHDGPGSTLRIYDPGMEAWRIIFVDPVHHAHNEMVGRRVGDDVIQQGYSRDRAIKWTFTDVTPKSFIWRGYHLADDGVQWVNEDEYRFHRAV